MRDFEITDEMLYNSAPKAEEIILSKIPDDKDLNHKFSRRFEKKMNRLIKEEKRHPAINKLYLYTKRTAIIFIIVATGLLTVTFSVEALRTKFINMVIKIYEEYTSITLNKEDTENENSSQPIPLKVPNYLGFGFNEVDRQVTPFLVFISYENSKQYTMTYEYSRITSESILDTENAEFEEINVNGYRGKYIVKDKSVTLFWNDNEFAYSIIIVSNNTDKINFKEDFRAEMIKIAKSIK